MTCVQRFGSALSLNPHLHVLISDGIWISDPEGRPTFLPAPPPSDDDLQHLVERTAQRLLGLLQRRGLLQDAPPGSPNPG